MTRTRSAQPTESTLISHDMSLLKAKLPGLKLDRQAHFKWRNDEEMQAEFRVAKSFLKLANGQAAPAGTVIDLPEILRRRKASGDNRELIDSEKHVVIEPRHRFMIDNRGEIYALSTGEILGEGSFGTVKLGQTVDKKLWAIKETKKLSGISLAQKETTTAKRVGLAITGFCHDGLPESSSSDAKFTTIYHYLGTSLLGFLGQSDWTNDAANKDKQYELAIKTCFKLWKLHIGFATADNKPLAHGDIKPENIVIDDKGNVHFIDYGFSQDLENRTDSVQGTSLYLPTSLITKNHTREELDVFALIRTLYLPRSFWFLKIPKDRKLPLGRAHCSDKNEMESIFSDKIVLENPALRNILDTSDGNIKDTSVADLLCKLILLRHNIFSIENFDQVKGDLSSFFNAYFNLLELGLDQTSVVKLIAFDPKIRQKVLDSNNVEKLKIRTILFFIAGLELAIAATNDDFKKQKSIELQKKLVDTQNLSTEEISCELKRIARILSHHNNIFKPRARDFYSFTLFSVEIKVLEVNRPASYLAAEPFFERAKNLLRIKQSVWESVLNSANPPEDVPTHKMCRQ